jgi:hypothetical protein
MKSLIYLGVSEDQIWIRNYQKIVYIEINLDSWFVIDELQNRHSTGRHVDESVFSRHFANNFATHFDKLVMIMSQWVKEHRCDINIRFFIPWSIMAASKAWYQDFTSDPYRIIFMFCLVKRVFYSIDNSVSYF